MSPCRRRPASLARALVLSTTLALLLLPARALASTAQQSMLQDDIRMLVDPAGTLQRLRLLGVNRLRIAVRWLSIAPRPSSRHRPGGFNAADPAAYPSGNWTIWDTIVKDAKQAGIAVNFNVVGNAPLWATGPGAPNDKPHGNWDPSPREFGSFLRALGKRYSGHYDPITHSSSAGDPNDLPAVRFWSIWNEPNYGPSLAPQGVPGHLRIENSPRVYRGLLDAAWSALRATGHGQDTILFGEVAPRGFPSWGVFSGMKPLIFLRALYCVDSSYRPLRGAAAAARGCPTGPAGSSRFRANHPGLFNASGFADHPYMRWYSPDREVAPDPDFSSLGELARLLRALDRLQRVYGSGTRFPIYNTEFGYLTSPPKHTNLYPWVSPSTAAYYLNWAEYISWRTPRLQSFTQYQISDPVPSLASNQYGGFASGLMTYGVHGVPKATYNAFRLPLYLPVTTGRIGHSLEVWGCARPTYFTRTDVPGEAQTVQIQFQPSSGGAFTTVKTVTITDPHGYFDTRVVFPSSGTVKLNWTYPADDPLLVPNYSVPSRHVQISIH